MPDHNEHGGQEALQRLLEENARLKQELAAVKTEHERMGAALTVEMALDMADGLRSSGDFLALIDEMKTMLSDVGERETYPAPPNSMIAKVKAMTVELPEEKDVDAWQVFLWNQPDQYLSRAEKLQFMLMLEGGFNGFDPFVVIRDLLKHRHLWHGAVMDRAFYLPTDHGPPLSPLRTDLIKLRDIESTWNVDTLFILTDAGKRERWQEVTKDWAADEMHFIEGEMVGRMLGCFGGPDANREILQVWWD